MWALLVSGEIKQERCGTLFLLNKPKCHSSTKNHLSFDAAHCWKTLIWMLFCFSACTSLFLFLLVVVCLLVEHDQRFDESDGIPMRNGNGNKQRETNIHNEKTDDYGESKLAKHEAILSL